MFDPGVQMLRGKIIGVFEVHFFSKVDSNRFFTTPKYAKISKFVQNWQRQKMLKINFFSKTKNDRVMAISFENLNQTFLKS